MKVDHEVNKIQQAQWFTVHGKSFGFRKSRLATFIFIAVKFPSSANVCVGRLVCQGRPAKKWCCLGISSTTQSWPISYDELWCMWIDDGTWGYVADFLLINYLHVAWTTTIRYVSYWWIAGQIVESDRVWKQHVGGTKFWEQRETMKLAGWKVSKTK